jgi:hypothetical protein
VKVLADVGGKKGERLNIAHVCPHWLDSCTMYSDKTVWTLPHAHRKGFFLLIPEKV